MSKLFLTKEEQSVFDQLSADLKEGWDATLESLQYQDTMERQIMRLSLIRLHDPKLQALRSASQNAQTVDDVVAIVSDFDLKNIDEDDLAELFFAMGPNVMSGLIVLQLQSVKTDADIEGVSALTVIRHSLLESFHPVS